MLTKRPRVRAASKAPELFRHWLTCWDAPAGKSITSSLFYISWVALLTEGDKPGAQERPDVGGP